MKFFFKQLLLIACLLFVSLGYSQNKTIIGSVTDQQGSPLPGVSILIKGTTRGTQTDFDGNYTLQAREGDVLVFSFIGFSSQEKKVLPGGLTTTVNIQLKENLQELEDVVVIGYGTAKKSTYAGSVQTIGSQQIEARAITNITSVLDGNTTGVQITTPSGQPGSSPQIVIRGFGSVSASNAPVYVIDGVIDSRIGMLNTNDIESVTVLKDAASTAIYGSSAGNGVVLITTKKGKQGKSNITFNASTGISMRAFKDYERVNVYEYIPLQWQMLKNAYITSGDTADIATSKASNEIISTLGGYNPFLGIADTEVVGLNGLLNPNASTLKWGDDLDWEKAAHTIGARQDYNISYNSKTDKNDIFASIGYLDEKGHMRGTDFERFAGRINYNLYSTDWFKTGLRLAATRRTSNYSNTSAGSSSTASNITRFIRQMAPIYPIHRHDLVTGAYLDSDGNVTTDPRFYTSDYLGSRLSVAGRDAIYEQKLNDFWNTINSAQGSTYFTVIPIKGLNLTANYHYANNDGRRRVFYNPEVGDGAPSGYLQLRSTRSIVKTFNQTVQYTKELGKHHFDLLLGHENYDYSYESLQGHRTGQVVAGFKEFSNFTDIRTLTSSSDAYRKESYFGRLSYELSDKYTFTASARTDGSSRFHRDNRWGSFYSVGGAWILSRENFLREKQWIDYLKLRASWGQTGNDQILTSSGSSNYYPYQTLYYLGINNRSESGAYISGLSNKDIKWETQVSTDLALDFVLLNNRLSGNVEYFKKESKDLLFNAAMAMSNGISSIVQNVGKSENRGLEVELNYQFLKTNSWKASLGINATFLRNRLTKLPEESRENGITSGSQKLMEGRSLYEFWLRQWWGVDPATGDGLYLFNTEDYDKANASTKALMDATIVEIDGQKLTNSSSYAKYDYSGSSIPDVYGGFNFKIGYKSVELSTIFTYALGGKILDSTYDELMSLSSYGKAMHSDIKNAWQQPGDITNVPRLDNNAAHASNIGASSTRWLVNADYLNFRTATLSWKLPKNFIEPLKLSNVAISLTGENIFLLKKRQGLSPQAQLSGYTYNDYLPARTISFGLNASF